MAPRDTNAVPESFVERHGLWTAAQRDAAAQIGPLLQENHIDVVRISFADQHGLLRGKTVVAGELPRVLASGCPIVTSLLLKDTSHRTVFPVFTAGAGFNMPELEGAADLLMVPDPTTFRVLPWAPNTGWLLCDLYFADGKPALFSTRQLCRSVIGRLHEAGYDFVAGLEVEFHIFKLENPHLALNESGQPGVPPDVSLLTQGYQYLTEARYDQLDPILDVLRRDLMALGLPLRSLEVEFGPSQVELTFRAGVDLESADMMVLLRSAVKQICRRHGYHATFMCRPAIPNVLSSGWHLHQSLRDRHSGANAFIPGGPGGLSEPARHWLGGLLAHARAATVFAAPTINAYKRYRAYSLAPDRAIWGRDNRGAMIRVLGAPGDPASRLENRVGEPAANPYLYFASQIAAGLDGLQRQLDPGPSADTPYETKAPLLPKSLAEALDLLRADPFFRTAFGDGFITYYLRLKDAEIARFQAEVTDWEQREYFDVF
jgi:glutamine synthetase